MAAYMFQRNVLVGQEVSMAFFLSFSPLTTIKKYSCFQGTASAICKMLFLLVVSPGMSYTYT